LKKQFAQTYLTLTHVATETGFMEQAYVLNDLLANWSELNQFL